MSNETKRDVFDEVWNRLSEYRVFFNGWPREAIDEYKKRYNAALPDDLPVIPQAVEEYIQKRKAVCDSLAFTLTARLTPNEVYGWMCTVTGDSDTELSQIEYVKQQDTFARAWVLGVWRVEETGEIVRLEAEK